MDFVSKNMLVRQVVSPMVTSTGREFQPLWVLLYFSRSGAAIASGTETKCQLAWAPG